MVAHGNILPFPVTTENDAFLASRAQLSDILIGHCLIDSYRRFRSRGASYPFTAPQYLLPNSSGPKVEQPYQNTALVFIVDPNLPRSLNKHFRLRGSNRVTWRNIQRMAPELDLTDYKAASCRLDSPQAPDLIARLSRLDYALMIEQEHDSQDPAFRLTHMHVKVERLTDNAIKDLAKELGYIDRRLFERGEDYVDALETKFYEYFGFSADASGRKSAAAVAAQLLGAHARRFGVFVASQEDCRLTRLDESQLVTQYMLVRLDTEQWKTFDAAAHATGQDATGYIVLHDTGGEPVVILRSRFQRTAPALGTDAGHVDRSLEEPWLAIERQAIIPPPGENRPAVPFDWCATDPA